MGWQGMGMGDGAPSLAPLPCLDNPCIRPPLICQSPKAEEAKRKGLDLDPCPLLLAAGNAIQWLGGPISAAIQVSLLSSHPT